MSAWRGWPRVRRARAGTCKGGGRGSKRGREGRAWSRDRQQGGDNGCKGLIHFSWSGGRRCPRRIRVERRGDERRPRLIDQAIGRGQGLSPPLSSWIQRGRGPSGGSEEANGPDTGVVPASSTFEQRPCGLPERRSRTLMEVLRHPYEGHRHAEIGLAEPARPPSTRAHGSCGARKTFFERQIQVLRTPQDLYRRAERRLTASARPSSTCR